MTVLNTPEGVSYARYASLKGMLKLESLGMKSRSGALRPRLAKEFGLAPRASYDAYIAYCYGRMQELLAALGKDR